MLETQSCLGLDAWLPHFFVAHDKATADPCADLCENADACCRGTFPAASGLVSILPPYFYIYPFPLILASHTVKCRRRINYGDRSSPATLAAPEH